MQISTFVSRMTRKVATQLKSVDVILDVEDPVEVTYALQCFWRAKMKHVVDRRNGGGGNIARNSIPAMLKEMMAECRAGNAKEFTSRTLNGAATLRTSRPSPTVTLSTVASPTADLGRETYQPATSLRQLPPTSPIISATTPTSARNSLSTSPTPVQPNRTATPTAIATTRTTTTATATTPDVAVPKTMVIRLIPRSQHVNDALASSGLNPLLQLTFRLTKPLSFILNHLSKKWGVKLRAAGFPASFRVFPAQVLIDGASPFPLSPSELEGWNSTHDVSMLTIWKIHRCPSVIDLLYIHDDVASSPSSSPSSSAQAVPSVGGVMNPAGTQATIKLEEARGRNPSSDNAQQSRGSTILDDTSERKRQTSAPRRRGGGKKPRSGITMADVEGGDPSRFPSLFSPLRSGLSSELYPSPIRASTRQHSGGFGITPTGNSRSAASVLGLGKMAPLSLFNEVSGDGFGAWDPNEYGKQVLENEESTLSNNPFLTPTTSMMFPPVTPSKVKKKLKTTSTKRKAIKGDTVSATDTRLNADALDIGVSILSRADSISDPT
eukprot:TRINITY_DN539_c0_g1_i2.p1 TRINITY_DN539_c0_g1~~TRINITY_DN539_c0_g1_i2.p1  ORF type:complete len:551 (-),score=95.53 TRINITY_DN539_c0_g1_i2:930-2582(-)